MKHSLSWPRSASVKRLPALVAGSLILLLSACSDDDTTTTLDAAPEVSFGLPDSILAASFLDSDNLLPQVSLSNGAVVSIVQTSARRWSGRVNLRTDTVFKVTVTWVELFMGQVLPLTSNTFDLAVGKDGSAVEANRTDFVEDFDNDNDGATNFDERRAGTDPLDPNSIPVIANFADAGSMPAMPVTADVIVPRISPIDAPTVDGVGIVLSADYQFAGEWRAAVQSDISGAPLSIDNHDPEHRWAAVHDGTHLYVAVVVDDKSDNKLKLVLGAENNNTARQPSRKPLKVEFSPASATANVVELRIAMDSAGVSSDTPFGIKLQLNDHWYSGNLMLE